MRYLSNDRRCYTKTKPQHAAPLIVSDIKNMLAPLPNRYTRGEFSVPVTTTADPMSDGLQTVLALSWSLHARIYQSTH